MKITYQIFDHESKEHIDALYSWEYDPDLYKLTTPIFKPEDEGQTITKEVFKSKYMKSGKWVHEIHMIYVDDKPVCIFSMMMDPGHLYKKVPGTSWLGLTIGDKNYWGKGVAAKAMEKFEEVSRGHNAVRIELGVFEFNPRAIKFYTKLGYIEIGRIKDFTYSEGRFWDDIRMEKIL